MDGVRCDQTSMTDLHSNLEPRPWILASRMPPHRGYPGKTIASVRCASRQVWRGTDEGHSLEVGKYTVEGIIERVRELVFDTLLLYCMAQRGLLGESGEDAPGLP